MMWHTRPTTSRWCPSIEIWWLEAMQGLWTHCHIQEASLRSPFMLEGASMIIWGTVGIKGVRGQQPYSGTFLNNVQSVLKDPKNIPHVYIPSPAWTVNRRLYLHYVEVKLWPYHLNVTTHQTRQHFSALLLSKLGESVQNVLFLADRSSTRCAGPFAPRFSVWFIFHTLCVITGYLSFCSQQ